MKNIIKKVVVLLTMMTLATTLVIAAEEDGDTPTHTCSDSTTEIKTVNETCTVDGKIEVRCTVCNSLVDTKTINKLGHSFAGTETVTKQATCYSEGTKTIQCIRCTETTSTSIPKTAHTMSSWTLLSRATKCTEYDKEVRKCTNSGCTYQETRDGYSKGPCAENSTRKNAKQATCKESGYTGDVTCKYCNRVIVQGSTIDKTDHVASTTLKNKEAASCNKEGYSGDMICKYCDTVMERGVYLPKTEHVKDTGLKNIKEATCKEEGYTGDIVCKNCQTILEKGTKIEKKAHEASEELKNKKEATCKDAGYTGDTVCKMCGEVMKKGSITVTLPHQPKLINTKEATCKEEGYTGDEVCEVCNTKVNIGKNIPKTNNHKFGEWKTIQEPTETTKGTEEHECSVCFYTETRNIPKLGNSSVTPEDVDTGIDDGYTENTITSTEDEPLNLGIELEEEETGSNTAIKVMLAVGAIAVIGGVGTLVYFKKFRNKEEF